jgi:hypothetical protein
MRQLNGKDFAGCHIITVGEAARNDKNLVAVQQAGLLAQPIDVDALGNPTRQLEGELRFLVAVRAGGTQDYSPWFGHGVKVIGLVIFLVDELAPVMP